MRWDNDLMYSGKESISKILLEICMSRSKFC